MKITNGRVTLTAQNNGTSAQVVTADVTVGLDRSFVHVINGVLVDGKTLQSLTAGRPPSTATPPGTVNADGTARPPPPVSSPAGGSATAARLLPASLLGLTGLAASMLLGML